MNGCMSAVLWHIVISYLDSFDDIHNLLFDKKDSLCESEIYASFTPTSKLHFYEYLKKFNRMRVINFELDNSYVTDTFLEHNSKFGIDYTDSSSGIFDNVYKLCLGDNTQITNDGLKFLSNIRELHLGIGHKIKNDKIKLLIKNECAVRDSVHRAIMVDDVMQCIKPLLTSNYKLINYVRINID
jgi:hypothetical protein